MQLCHLCVFIYTRAYFYQFHSIYLRPMAITWGPWGNRMTDLDTQVSTHLPSAVVISWLKLSTVHSLILSIHGGRAVEHRTVNREDGGLIPPTPVRNFVNPHLPVSIGRDTKRQWSLLSDVYAKGSRWSHTRGRYVKCSGLTNSREGKLR